MKTNLVFQMFALALFSGLIFAFATMAQAQGMQQAAATPPMGMSSQQQAILAEAWTLTPQATAWAGMPDLPLRNCEGLYCGILAKMPLGTQVDILVNDREGWALVHVPSRSMYGWVNTNNILF
ncbi:SH3 domain-containing protein [Solidesulfovibrio sp. C21]|uniref:SH3 domain-containing protein n=1 Tax=Solidesulfovibrio sp. C21 TaxID=3398613 RepID=UPI0039FBE136